MRKLPKIEFTPVDGSPLSRSISRSRSELHARRFRPRNDRKGLSIVGSNERAFKFKDRTFSFQEAMPRFQKSVSSPTVDFDVFDSR